MQTLTFVAGMTLVLLGVGFNMFTGAPTALIPVIPGLVIGIAGVLARKPERRKFWMHVAVGVSALCFLAGMTGVVKLLQHVMGTPIDRMPAALEQMLMSVFSLAYLIPCVKSFAAARAAQKPPEA
jgi:hypothetical protein